MENMGNNFRLHYLIQGITHTVVVVKQAVVLKILDRYTMLL